ncbi:MAG: hypothetical protein CMH60_04085 [Myxococcales bacterium]|nr:hypothetical protein [Myxococcales bacterium]|tara:strand:+ start:414 stop:632 length:219 start_codon:yes stop_codon:yes gene_type:complete
MANTSYLTDGTEEPIEQWLRKTVRVRKHPEWGNARVLRWYPAAGSTPQRLRILAENNPAPQIVSILEVEVLS